MKDFLETIAGVIALVVMIVPWLMGLVLAQGFWSNVFAFFPPYAWYLVVEHAMKLSGWI